MWDENLSCLAYSAHPLSMMLLTASVYFGVIYTLGHDVNPCYNKILEDGFCLIVYNTANKGRPTNFNCIF